MSATLLPVLHYLTSVSTTTPPLFSAGQESSHSSPQYIASWDGYIWGLPNGVLPAGPVMGQGDFGMTLQTNNNTGCIEFWLGK